jgi:hypothetical protein
VPDHFGLTPMSREFGKRTVERSPRQADAPPIAAAAPKPAAGDPEHMRKAVLAIGLTVAIVGGMFLLPKLGQCDGRRGLFGLDWCRLMKASVEGGVRGVAAGAGRGTISSSGR